MTNVAEVEEYNYSVFVGSEQYMAFRALLPVGSSAPDFQAKLLDGTLKPPLTRLLYPFQ